MRKRRQKSLKVLYALTEEISQPEITPILEGSCRMQGPTDELDYDIPTCLDLCSSEQGSEKHYLNESMETESGTCNVCSAPCSSCMHFNQAFSVMDSKTEGGFSNNGCGRRDTDHHSSVSVTSETSILFKASTSHDSFSENAEISKAPVTDLDTYDDASKDVDMPPTVASCGAVEEDQYSAKQQDGITQAMPSSHSHTAVDMLLKTFPSRDEEHRGLECNGDNISGIEGVRDANFSVSVITTNLNRKSMPPNSASTSSFGKDIKVVAKVPIADGETEDTQSNSKRPSTTKESAQKNIPRSSSPNAGNADESGPVDSALSNRSTPKEQSPQSHSPSLDTICTTGSKDVEENLSEPLGESVKLINNSVMNGQKSTLLYDSTNLASYEDCKASHIRIVSSSEAFENNHQCMEIETATDSGRPSTMQGVQMQPQLTAESDNTGQESLEDDVKVCDICGDMGREELLAICSRCSDGAEHIYCMRNMLVKVPEGDWLCEECNLKEDAESQKVDNSETMSAMSKTVCLDGKSQNIRATSNPKISAKLDVQSIDSEAPPSGKGLEIPQISMKSPSEAASVTSVSNRKSPETCDGSSGTASPSRKNILSNEISTKNLDAVKEKTVTSGPLSGSHSVTGFQAISQSPTSSSPMSSRVQAQLQSPHSFLTKSISFNNLKPKVKQVSEIVPQKPNVVRESANNDTKKDGLVRTISKSASSKNMSFTRSNVIGQTSKTQSLNPLQLVESWNLRQSKEKIALERKNSIELDKTQISSSPAPATSIPLLKVNMKTTQFDEKSPGLSGSNAIIAHKGSKDALGTVRKQLLYPSNTCGNSSNGTCNFDMAEPSKTTVVVDVKKETLFPSETIFHRRDEENAIPLIAEESKVKPPVQIFPIQDFVVGPLRGAAIPEHNFIWQGGFEVWRKQGLPELYDGLQAHLSTCASPKVIEVVTRFPSKIHLDEVSLLSAWPLQFQEKCPTDENIALFFFAKDAESYEKNYVKLLGNVLNNDLVLKGNLDSFELLIFPSNKLPKDSQRWNQSFFLWGIFRRKSSDSQNRICGSNLNVKNMVEDLPSQLKNEVSMLQKNELLGASNGKKVVELPVHVQTSSMQIDSNIDSVLPAHLIASDCRHIDFSLDLQGRQGTSSLLSQGSDAVGSRDEEKMKDIERLTERGTASESEAWGSNAKELSWELKPTRKRAHSYSPEPVLQVSGELSGGKSAKLLWEEKPRYIYGDEVRKSKRVKLDTDPHVSSVSENNFSEGLSSKLHPPLADFFKDQLRRDSFHNETNILESIGNSKRYLLPDKSGPVLDKPGNLIPLQVLSSDDEDQRRSDIPNLDLALGIEKKSHQRGSKPLFFPLIDKKNSHEKMTHPADNVMDDAAASLSLSLAFPFPEKERAGGPVPNKEELLPEMPRANKSLLLFGGVLDR